MCGVRSYDHIGPRPWQQYVTICGFEEEKEEEQPRKKKKEKNDEQAMTIIVQPNVREMPICNKPCEINVKQKTVRQQHKNTHVNARVAVCEYSW